MKKLLPIIVLSLTLVGAGCSRNSSSGNPVSTTPVSQANPTATTYTMADVAAANSPGKCWSVVDGKVYNLTSWIAQHPGGPDNIISMCGKDASAAYNMQHGGQRRPEQMLTQFEIGTLVP